MKTADVLRDLCRDRVFAAFICSCMAAMSAHEPRSHTADPSSIIDALLSEEQLRLEALALCVVFTGLNALKSWATSTSLFLLSITMAQTMVGPSRDTMQRLHTSSFKYPQRSFCILSV